MNLTGKIALVTGASRGVGRGIAIELGRAGATVYITGRTLDTSGKWPGSLEKTVREVEAIGGQCIPLMCDHTDDQQVHAVFHQIEQESGALDVLVNNAYAAAIASGRSQEAASKRFWELPIDAWDRPIQVGLRSHYVAAVMAMPMLMRSHGLIINISSPGAYVYFNSVPYGIGKAGVDRMTKDMAHDIGDEPVTVVSLWPGLVGTERVTANFSPEFASNMIHNARVLASHSAGVSLPAPNDATSATKDDLDALTESPNFAGKAIVAIASDLEVKAYSGRTLSVARIARQYGFTDTDGRVPDAFRFDESHRWPTLQ